MSLIFKTLKSVSFVHVEGSVITKQVISTVHVG